MDNLLDLMKHVGYFYEPIPSTYEKDRKFTVYLRDTRWTITDSKTEKDFGTTNPEHALGFLVEAKADLSLLHSLISTSICTEGCNLRRKLKTVEDLVGTEAIDTAEAGWKDFAKNLADIINTVIEEKDKPDLKLVH
jgi:hypothetical protein